MSLVLKSKSFPGLGGVHHGTGVISDRCHVADPTTLLGDWKDELEFKFRDYRIHVLSLEIDGPAAPNWFGVAFRSGITSFDSINIFCHPHPGNAGMADADYAGRGGNWPKLFRYAETLGRQLAIAQSSQIVVVPFFSNAAYGGLGVFATQWIDLMEQVIQIAQAAARGSATELAADAAQSRARTGVVLGATRMETTSPTMKKGMHGEPARSSSSVIRNVVISCFSRGRALANTMRNVHGMGGLLREVWDFDGVGGGVPVAPRAITYDQHRVKSTVDRFHVPPERWVKYHNKIVANVHGDIPTYLACHAACESRIGGGKWVPQG